MSKSNKNVQRSCFSPRPLAMAVAMAVSTGAVAAVEQNLRGISLLTVSTTTDSVVVYYSDNNYTVPLGGSNYTVESAGTGARTNGIDVGAISEANIVVNSGVDISGTTSITGGVAVAIYSRDTDDLSAAWDDFSFSGRGVVTFEGNNNIVGVVGYHDSAGDIAPTSDGADSLALVNVSAGSNGTIFNDAVNANRIEINSGGNVGFNGAVNSTIDLNDNNVQLSFGDGVTVAGGIVQADGTSSSSSVNVNGTATFGGNIGGGTGTNTLAQLLLNGGTSELVSASGAVSSSLVRFDAGSTLLVIGDLDVSRNPDADTNIVDFDNVDGGSLILGGDLIGIAGQNVLQTSTDGTGRVTMASGAQQVTGALGSETAAIASLTIGSVAAPFNSASQTTVDGDVFADSVVLNFVNSTSSRLTLASGSSLTSTGGVTTSSANTGFLTFAGGEQAMTGQVGNSGARLNLLTVASGSGSVTSFDSEVYSVFVDSSEGTANFEQSVFGTTLRVGSGSVNLDTVTATTSDIDVTFGLSGSTGGIVNLNQGLDGNINFASGSVVNLANGEEIDGTLLSNNPTVDQGILNILGSGSVTGQIGSGSAGTVAGALGAASAAIQAININTVSSAQGAGQTFTAEFDSDVFANDVNLNDGATLILASGADLVGNINSFVSASGAIPGVDTQQDNVLQILGSSVITGQVGSPTSEFGDSIWHDDGDFAIIGTLVTPSAGVSITRIEAGQDNSVTRIQNGTTFADMLTYNGQDGEVIVQGAQVLTAASVAAATFPESNFMPYSSIGFVGAVNFASGGAGTFTIGNGGFLVTQDDSLGDEDEFETIVTRFQNANSATLNFEGSAWVIGQLGVADEAADSDQTFAEIHAGANGSLVRFENDVYVSDDTFHVVGTGEVDFLGDLNGSLVFDDNGTVNVASGSAINGPVGALGDSFDGTGTINFMGDATTQSQMGVDEDPSDDLRAVNFHALVGGSSSQAVSTDDATVDISHNIYASTVQIGAASASASTTVNIGSDLMRLGTDLTLGGGNVTFNTYNTDLTEVSDGTILPGNDNNSAFDVTVAGDFVTNGATLNFAVGTSALTLASGAGLVSDARSSSITAASADVTSSPINVHLTSSVRDAEVATLIASSNLVGASGLALIDNSYVIDSELRDASSDLEVFFSRADDEYITKSATTGHFSNDAALRLGTLAANGTGYDADMVTALNTLDLDQWGYGNNEANLAVQVQKLAPTANHSIALSAYQTTRRVADAIGMEMHRHRLPESGDESGTWWARSIYTDHNQDSIGLYDGFDAQILGTTLGYDVRPTDDSMLGLAVSFTTTSVDQNDFRSGDSASISGLHLSTFGALNLDENWSLAANLTLSDLSTDTTRSTIVDRVANGSIEGTQATVDVTLGYDMPIRETEMVLTPFLNVHASSLDQDAYTETGSAGSVGLAIANDSSDRSEVALGLQLEGTSLWRGMVIKPDFSLAAVSINEDFNDGVLARFEGDTVDFTTSALNESDRDDTGLRAVIGLDLLMSESNSIDFNLRHDRTEDNDSTSVDLTARWMF